MQMAREYHKGKYTPKNPKKYVGNVENIVFRSGWEAEFMNKLDLNEDVLSWGSEEIVIPYYNPVKERMARYFPDMIIRQKEKDGSHSTVVVEIKPPNEITKPVRNRGKKASTYMHECLTWIQNQSKWRAAADWCQKRGATFVVVTKNNHNRFVILTEEQAIHGGR